MKYLLSALALLRLTSFAQAQSVYSVYDAPYTQWPTITAGTDYSPYPRLRGIAAHCTGSGTSTLTSPSGDTMLWDVSTGFQQQPFVIASFTAVAGCTFYGLR